MYVNEAIPGADKNKLVEAFKGAGFLLRKGTSNSKHILVDIPKEHLLEEDFLETNNVGEARMLGI